MSKLLIQLPFWYKLLMVFNVLLIVAGFIIPPCGVIDPSVLAAVGEIIIMGLIGILPQLLASGADVKISKGDASIEVNT